MKTDQVKKLASVKGNEWFDAKPTFNSDVDENGEVDGVGGGGGCNGGLDLNFRLNQIFKFSQIYSIELSFLVLLNQSACDSGIEKAIFHLVINSSTTKKDEAKSPWGKKADLKKRRLIFQKC